jgi:hypothetical protein
MDRKTHQYLAEQIHRHLVANCFVQMPLEPFVSANIRPDYTLHPVAHPHFAASSLHYIRRQIKKLAQTRLAPGQTPDRRFVTRLGRITHFFCTVHSKPIWHDPKGHIRYEQALDQAIEQDRARFDALCRFTPLALRQLPDRFEPIFRIGQISFASRSAGFERDIQMAVWFAAAVSLGILRGCCPQEPAGSARRKAPGDWAYWRTNARDNALTS